MIQISNHGVSKDLQTDLIPNGYCKDQIWRESKTGMDPGPRSPNNEFIECGKES